MEKKQTFNAVKKLENGKIAVQWKKGGKFVIVNDDMLAQFVVFYAAHK